MLSLETKPQEANQGESAKRKRFGQFFTGARLARLLMALAKPKGAASVVDPMCGTGDMLKAAFDFDPTLELAGIDIDDGVLRQAKKVLTSVKHVQLIKGSAFKTKILTKLRRKQFDLVITNPPYVRYQTLAAVDGQEMPTAEEIREDLLKSANLLLSNSEDQRLFREIIKSYSGLSDLAIPSWILAAMMTKEKGTLALVIPESWLTRDYAQFIQYILYRWFRPQYIVEDTSASWFPGALVKTTLLVAERTQRRPSAFLWQDEVYAHVRISNWAENASSLVGEIFPDNPYPEKEFASELLRLISDVRRQNTNLWSLELVRLADAADNLKNIVGNKQWLEKCENKNVISATGAIVPIELRRWLGDKKRLVSFEQAGIVVGQGLRTGANLFFYVDLIKNEKTSSLVVPNATFGIETMRVPAQYLRPVLRKQAELSEGYRVEAASLKGRVLLLPKLLSGSKELISFMQRAEKMKVRNVFIPKLSAVRTNAQRISSDRNGRANWYTLPPLAPRHTPALLIPRVNSSIPRTYASGLGLVVDANFSTIWLKSNSKFTAPALLALLNSSWAVANMELTGSVMGGGALKLEATHLKKISLPNMDTTQIRKLHALGSKLIQFGDNQTLNRIDKEVMRIFFKSDTSKNKLEQLKAIIQRRLKERTR